MKPKIGHEMIQASAGSGKTYALVDRYLKLLASGEDPSRITALTFTRKAAGEFLQSIFLRLTELAGSDEAAEKLCRDTGIEVHGSAFFRTLLGTLVKDIGRLQLGTIDHFFAKVVGAFPFELGLTRPHRIMDDFEQERARARTLQHLIDSASGELDSIILQLYKNLTWGAEEKKVYQLFDDRLKAHHQLFVETGDPVPWGDMQAIYKALPWWADAPEDRDALINDIYRELDRSGLDEKALQPFEAILHKFQAWQAGQDPRFSTLFDRILDERDTLPTGDVSVKFNRKTLDIPAPLGSLLLGLLKCYIGDEIKRKLLVTRSTGMLLDTYDRQYAQLIRETGSLVFADFPMLLIKALDRDASVISNEDLLYRLDTLTDHWLIDEFQDTSRIQWKVLSQFVDEVLQDPDGRRSFFYVGDVKQSIYSWRGGDPRLFNEIHEHYSRNGSGIQQTTREKSWRSGPAILDCVNRLFGPALAGSGLPDAVLSRWAENWKSHVPSEKTGNLDAYAGWGLLDKETSVATGCAEVIKAADPLSKGLTCAILVRKNDEVRGITQALRESGIPASMEARVNIFEDNVVGCWIRAFLYSLLRPGESFPREYLDTVGVSLKPGTYQQLVNAFRRALTHEGYAEAIRTLIAFLDDLAAGNRFLRLRAEQILEAATRFKSTGQDTLESFVRYMETSTVEEASLKSQVQVMTVHKAKGLDFDMVVVAGFGPQEICQSHNPTALHVERDDEGMIQWILDMPRKKVVEGDSCLETASRKETDNQIFEALCLLYVAMTRARQGLYCLAHSVDGAGSTRRWHHLFEAAFSGLENERREGPVSWQAEWGNPEWFARADRAVETVSRVQLMRLGRGMPVTPFLRLKASPSTEAHARGFEIRSLRTTDGRRFGTWMHAYLATIDWISFGDPEAIKKVVEAADEPLRERLLSFLDGPDAPKVFGQPECSCVLWREKPYALRDGNRLSQGVIDRAHVFLNANGQPGRVELYDFKTDWLDPEIPAETQLRERYAIQMERYREAVAILTGLDPENVSTSLIPV